MAYHKLHSKTEFQGLPISVENPKGGVRHWTDETTGEQGCTKMEYPYGYVRGTLGLDGDEVDVFVGPNKTSNRVFVITQQKKPPEGYTGEKPWVEVDEQKVMLGFDDPQEAQNAYMRHFNDARFFGHMIELTVNDFKARLETHQGKVIKGVLSSVVSKLRELATKFTRKDPSERAADEYFKDHHPKYTNKRDDNDDGEADRFYHAWVAHHRNTASKALKESSTPAILTQDNIPMLVLSKSAVKKDFKPVALKPGSEEKRMSMNKAEAEQKVAPVIVTKSKIVDTEEEEAQKGRPQPEIPSVTGAVTNSIDKGRGEIPPEHRAKFRANAKDTDKDDVPDGLDKDPKDPGSRKADLKKAAVRKVAPVLATSKEARDNKDEEELDKAKTQKQLGGATQFAGRASGGAALRAMSKGPVDPQAGVVDKAKEAKSNMAFGKSVREEAIELLRKSRSLSEEKMDLKKQNMAESYEADEMKSTNKGDWPDPMATEEDEKTEKGDWPDPMSVEKKFRSKDQVAYMHAAAERGEVPKKVLKEFKEKTPKSAYKKLPKDLPDKSIAKSLGEIDLEKALRAIAVAGMSRRARMDAAFQLGQAIGRTRPAFKTEAARIDVNVGTDRTRPTHEPPVVPLRRVDAPLATQPPQANHESCVVHGYVHKSDAPCPLCEQAAVAEAGPLWRR